ncbi:MAG: alkaline phosphatase family protein [Gemmatimonadota bacterium]|nr:alkaline phosphatase family protein [Gemmatimonadota bacterium]
MRRFDRAVAYAVLAVLTTSCGDAPETAPTADPERARWVEALARSWYPGRVGDLTIIPAEGWVITSAGTSYVFMHGGPWDYDTEIPGIIYGPGLVEPGVRPDAVSHQDLGATVLDWLDLTPDYEIAGRPVTGVLDEDARPAAIVVIVLDAFRADYLTRWADDVPTLRELASSGLDLDGARIDYLPTNTAAAHTTLATGTFPRVHGITGNSYFDRGAGWGRNLFEGASPENLEVPTVADLLGGAVEGAVIAIQGGTYYPAVGMAGHGACIAGGRAPLMTFYDERRGRWATNPDCYALPETLSEVDASGIMAEGDGTWLGHDVADPGEIRRTARFARFEAAALRSVISGTTFGEDDVTDLFLVNLKSTDYVSHKYGPFSVEMRETVRVVDGELAETVDLLASKTGDRGFVLMITSDHGMPDEPAGGAHRIRYPEVRELVDRHFDPDGPGVVAHFDGSENQMYLAHDRLAELGLAVADVSAFLETQPFARAAITEDEVRPAGGSPRSDVGVTSERSHP